MMVELKEDGDTVPVLATIIHAYKLKHVLCATGLMLHLNWP